MRSDLARSDVDGIGVLDLESWRRGRMGELARAERSRFSYGPEAGKKPFSLDLESECFLAECDLPSERGYFGRGDFASDRRLEALLSRLSDLLEA